MATKKKENVAYIEVFAWNTRTRKIMVLGTVAPEKLAGVRKAVISK